MTQKDEETGLSIRFIREWKPDKYRSVDYVDLAFVSCRWLGHTFVINEGESFCNVCGVPNPQVAPPEQAGS